MADFDPIPMRLPCPGTVPDGHGGLKICGVMHIDVGEFKSKPHHTHSCQACGMTWRPAVVHTVGVDFLPGFKNPTMTELSMAAIQAAGEVTEEESWLWAASRDEERWNGPETSIDACVGEAMEEGLEVFYVAQGQRVTAEDIERAVGWQIDGIFAEAEQYLIENGLVDPEGDVDAALWPDEETARAALMEWASKHIKCKSNWCRVLPETVKEIAPPTVGDLWFDPSEHAAAEIFAVSERFVQYFRYLLAGTPQRFCVPIHEWPLAYRLISARAARSGDHRCLLEAQSDTARCAYCSACSAEFGNAISAAKASAAAD